LGSSGLSVIELATGFGAIANRGVYQEPYAFTQILNPDVNSYAEI
jgi:membrane peptidoglycan carboxypeptidase